MIEYCFLDVICLHDGQASQQKTVTVSLDGQLTISSYSHSVIYAVAHNIRKQIKYTFIWALKFIIRPVFSAKIIYIYTGGMEGVITNIEIDTLSPLLRTTPIAYNKYTLKKTLKNILSNRK